MKKSNSLTVVFFLSGLLILVITIYFLNNYHAFDGSLKHTIIPAGLIMLSIILFLASLNEKRENDKAKVVFSGACIKNHKILLVNKKGFWILPGGKIEKGETEIDCLKREIKEEIPGIEIEVGEPYRQFYGNTPFSKTLACVKVFIIKVHGNDLSASAEISEARFFSLKELRSENVSEITKKIIKKLVRDNYF